MGNINFLLIHFKNTTFLAFVIKILKVLLITNFITVSTEVQNMPLGIIRFLFVFRESVKLLKLFENVQCRWGDSKIYCIYCTIRTNRVPAQQNSL
jgi:hypothetical protein